jgi:hypothetical protein
MAKPHFFPQVAGIAAKARLLSERVRRQLLP